MRQLVDIQRDARAAAEARHMLRGVDGRFRRDDADLLVTEVVTNAVRHGAGDSIRIQLDSTASGGLRCEVIDAGSGFVPPREPRPHDDRAGGWGLMLLDRLSDAWGVHAGSTHVWFELAPAA
jgi:anti-sigma regulatory factor (Ser/Thr protein kinase)